eukprot:scaffold24743_cov236-Isochrysis_galbana.AAC.1
MVSGRHSFPDASGVCAVGVVGGFSWLNKTRFCPRPYAPNRGRTETASTRLLRRWSSSRPSQRLWGMGLEPDSTWPMPRGSAATLISGEPLQAHTHTALGAST